MKTITKKEFIAFIMAQPPNRELNMNQSGNVGDCGCVMIHYGKEILKMKDPRASMKTITDYENFSNWAMFNRFNISTIVKGKWDQMQLNDPEQYANYGLLQESLKARGLT